MKLSNKKDIFVGLKSKIFILWCLGICVLEAFAQIESGKGMPPMEHFSPQQYQNKGKIWDIASAPNGIVYMAADKALLEYDGIRWNAFKGSQGAVRSLIVCNDSLLYTGSDLDFGVWKRNKYKQFIYTSLYPFKEETKALNEEFWDIHLVGDVVFFVSANSIYAYKNEQLTKITAPSRFLGCHKLDNELYFQDQQKGFLKLVNLKLISLSDRPSDFVPELAGMYKDQDKIILVSKHSGLYQWDDGKISRHVPLLSSKLSEAKVFSFQTLDANSLAFGTVLNGLFITNRQGEVLHHINKKKGLPNNTVLSAHHSKFGKLWLGLDKGLAAINLLSDFTFVFDYLGNFGSGYAACIHNERFYLGTNQGLYTTAWAQLSNAQESFVFQLIPGTEGQVWDLQIIDRQLMMGHDKGLFMKQDGKFVPISAEPGVWTIVPFRQDMLLTGNYNGISIFRKENNAWKFARKMEDIFGSCNQIVVENPQTIWVRIPNYGLIRAKLDQDGKPLERMIIPEEEFNDEVKYLDLKEGKIKAITEHSIYTYDSSKNKFVKDQNASAGLQFPAAVEVINHQPIPIAEGYSFYPLFNGFALTHTVDKNNPQIIVPPLIRRGIDAFNNDTLITINPDTLIPYELNNLRIEWVVPNTEGVRYQFKMDGSQHWTDLSPTGIFEIINLKPGKHQIWARALVNDRNTEAVSLSIRIAYPWYRSGYAYATYALTFLLIGWGLYQRQQYLLKKQRKLLLQRKEAALQAQAAAHEQEVKAMEQAMLQKEYEQLKQQLKSKTIELANKAKDNDEKKNLLLTLKEKVESLHNDPAQAKFRLSEIRRLLDSHLNVEDHTFEIQIDELHQEFYRKLKEKFPSLSIHDLRLCAYLKIGLNSKEIAEIMNILPSSVFVNRSRLRKKLNLPADTDLTSYFMNLNND